MPPFLLIPLAAFLYTGCVLDRVSDHGTKIITKPAIIQTVKGDGKTLEAAALKAKAEAADTLAHGIPDYSTVNK